MSVAILLYYIGAIHRVRILILYMLAYGEWCGWSLTFSVFF